MPLPGEGPTADVPMKPSEGRSAGVRDGFPEASERRENEMILIPSLDLMGGKVVALRDGRRDRAEVLTDDPIGAARELRALDALFFHVVDLDAAFGTGDNFEVIRGFADQMLPCQVSGGVRTAEQVERLIDAGVDRIVLGTLFFQDPDAARGLVERFGRRIMAALDLENGQVRTNGWENATGHGLRDAVELLHSTGVGQIVHTAIDRGAEPGGPDLPGLRELLALTECQVFANARVRGKQDLEDLGQLEDQGLVGTILSRAYEMVAA
jgi:phosphoribosylformimino-5-aminoimidazole carboxamide ribotide isomerase